MIITRENVAKTFWESNSLVLLLLLWQYVTNDLFEAKSQRKQWRRQISIKFHGATESLTIKTSVICWKTCGLVAISTPLKSLGAPSSHRKPLWWVPTDEDLLCWASSALLHQCFTFKVVVLQVALAPASGRTLPSCDGSSCSTSISSSSSSCSSSFQRSRSRILAAPPTSFPR